MNGITIFIVATLTIWRMTQLLDPMMVSILMCEPGLSACECIVNRPGAFPDVMQSRRSSQMITPLKNLKEVTFSFGWPSHRGGNKLAAVGSSIPSSDDWFQ